MKPLPVTGCALVAAIFAFGALFGALVVLALR